MSNFADADSRWQAVCERNAAASGWFCYAVLTTGIYCRPGCSSRQPKRENVRFFDNVAQAAAAGFRACKRCKPGETSPEELLLKTITAACRSIESAAEPVELAALADEAGLSIWHFQRLFSRLVGVSPKAYQRHWQSCRFSEALQDQLSVTEAVSAAGISSAASVYGDNRLGMTPREFRGGATGLQIFYALGQSEAGSLVIAVSHKGICCVEFCEATQTAAEQLLQQRFPGASLVASSAELQDIVDDVLACVARPEQHCQFPLDIQGTAFQARVWQVLQQIPAGETMSYSQLAIAIGQPSASRAVANACGANKLAVLIPCHRIVRGDGGPGGYKWGIERKQQLLANEQKSGTVSRVTE